MAAGGEFQLHGRLQLHPKLPALFAEHRVQLSCTLDTSALVASTNSCNEREFLVRWSQENMSAPAEVCSSPARHGSWRAPEGCPVAPSALPGGCPSLCSGQGRLQGYFPAGDKCQAGGSKGTGTSKEQLRLWNREQCGVWGSAQPRTLPVPLLPSREERSSRR